MVVIGGQLIYPVSDEDWAVNEEMQQQVLDHIDEINQREGAELYPSIYLGGYIVVGGNEEGLKALEKTLPQVDERYPDETV